MENLGYKEGSAKPKPSPKRRMSRSRAASVVENEILPLSLSPRYDIWMLFCIIKKSVFLM